MEAISGIPYSTAEFDKHGTCIRRPAPPDDTRELIIASHGWNNERARAERLYLDLFTSFAQVRPGGTAGLAIIGVIWPSKKFDLGEDIRQGGQDGAVRAAATAGQDEEARRLAIAHLFAQFEQVFDEPGERSEVARLRALLPDLAQADAQREFVRGLRALAAEPGAEPDFDDPIFFFEASDPRDVFVNARQASAEVSGAAPGAAGPVAGAGLGDLFDGLTNAVDALLNTTTYFEMKKRAGTVGSVGLAPLIDLLAERAPLRRIHLVGHSFGARLVTAAAMESTTPKLYSLSLLQAAFSHNGFAAHGYFRKVVREKRLAGPIIVTHTPNDTDVGKLYAIASRIGRDSTSGLGDSRDKYGGLGRNGAVNMGQEEVSRLARQLLPDGQPYTLTPQLIHNLESSAFIRDHGAVTGKEVAWAISCAMAA